MIQDVFKLKKDSWHMKLMTTIWGYDHHDFPNMCPYFWLSVLNVIIAPVFFIFVLLAPFFVKLLEIIDAYKERRKIQCRQKEEEWIEKIRFKIKNSPDDPVVNKLARLYYLTEYKDKKISYKMRQLFYGYSEGYVTLAEKAREFRQNERNRKEIKTYSSRQEIANYTIKIKQTAKIAGFIFLGTLLFLFVKLFIFLWQYDWSYYFWKALVGFFKVILITIVAVIILFLIYLCIEGIKKLWCKYGDMCIPCYERRLKFNAFIKMMFKGLSIPFIWIWRGFVQLFYILKALKNNNCPGIDWE